MNGALSSVAVEIWSDHLLRKSGEVKPNVTNENPPPPEMILGRGDRYNLILAEGQSACNQS